MSKSKESLRDLQVEKPVASDKQLRDSITSRFEITTNVIKAKNISDPDRKVAIIDLEGPIGFDFEKWWNDEDQTNTGAAIREKLTEISALQVDEIKVNLIETPGGSVEDGIAIYEALLRHPAKITTDVMGYAASISTIIMQAADPGNRKMSTNAMALVHSPMIPIMGYMNSTEIQAALELTETLQRRMSAIYTKHGISEAHKPFAEANRGNGKWMLASEAKSIGLVDEVYEPFSGRAVAALDTMRFAGMAKSFKLPKLPKAETGREPEHNNDANPKEKSMNEEQLLAALAKNNEAMAKSIAEVLAAAIKPADAVASVAIVPEVKVAFEGDLNDAEAVAKFEQEQKITELEKAVDRSSVASIREFQKAVAEIRGEAPVAKVPGAPAANTSLVQKTVSAATNGVNKKDLDDSVAYMKSISNKEK